MSGSVAMSAVALGVPVVTGALEAAPSLTLGNCEGEEGVDSGSSNPSKSTDSRKSQTMLVS